MSLLASNLQITDGSNQLHTIFSAYVGIAICIIGFFGNIISISVWRRINNRRYDSGKSAGMFLISLAIVDSGLLIFFTMTESFQSISTEVKYTYYYVWFYCFVGFPMYFFFIVASIWMVISITYNRFVAVVFPHKTSSLNTIRKSYIIIFLTLFFSFAINMPHFFNFHPIQDVNGHWAAGKTNYGKTYGATMYDFWGHCMLLVLIPWLIISILNGVIIYKLYSNRPTVSKKKFSKEHQTTIILLTVSFAFLFFLIWQCITQCFYMLHFKSNNKEIWYDISSAYAPARLGVVLNSSINFVLYCLSGQMFRKEMLRMFAEFCGCNNYLILLDSSTTMSNTVSRGSFSKASLRQTSAVQQSNKSKENCVSPQDINGNRKQITEEVESS
ncbi:FMRFamide receptor-like [Clytia hemisphaerica]|uniref:FMRFamide receptor-like n=1 Tax=Clytia hemisphaerica TaxID=252671 RepID=UPI0034D3F1EC